MIKILSKGTNRLIFLFPTPPLAVWCAPDCTALVLENMLHFILQFYMSLVCSSEIHCRIQLVDVYNIPS